MNFHVGTFVVHIWVLAKSFKVLTSVMNKRRLNFSVLTSVYLKFETEYRYGVYY